MTAAFRLGQYKCALAMSAGTEWMYLGRAAPFRRRRDGPPFRRCGWSTFRIAPEFGIAVGYRRGQLDKTCETPGIERCHDVEGVFTKAARQECGFLDTARPVLAVT